MSGIAEMVASLAGAAGGDGAGAGGAGGVALEVGEGGREVVVRLGPHGERTQRVFVEDRGEDYAFWSVVLGKGEVDAMEWGELVELVWVRNAKTPLVAFMVDGRGRLVGRVDHRKRTLDAGELGVILRVLGRECDRLEWLVTGRDRR